MKYYIIVDSLDIVRSTDTAAIDPVATEKKAWSKLFAAQEYMVLFDQMKKLKGILKSSKSNTDQYRNTSKRIVDLNITIKKMFSQYVDSNSVYMSIAPGDGLKAVEVSNNTFDDCNDLLATTKGFVSFFDGELSLVTNNSGKYFYKDENSEWQSYVCTDPFELIPGDWICVGELSDIQKTEIRLQSETPEDRATRLYDEKFTDFLTRIFLESPEYKDYEKASK